MPFKQLVQIIIAGSQVSPSILSYKLDTLLQVVGKAFTQAVRQEIRLSQEAITDNYLPSTYLQSFQCYLQDGDDY